MNHNLVVNQFIYDTLRISRFVILVGVTARSIAGIREPLEIMAISTIQAAKE